jgi:hypothetical protein
MNSLSIPLASLVLYFSYLSVQADEPANVTPAELGQRATVLQMLKNQAGATSTAASIDIYQVKTIALKQTADGKTNVDSPLTTELKGILEKQAASWNRGDIPAFMDAYWRSDKLTFSSGGKTTRGWEATRDQYLKNYPDRKTMGTLKFSELEVQSLDDHAALMLGRWHLTRDQPVGGNFSLVWQRIDGKWVIIHDHSSKDADK